MPVLRALLLLGDIVGYTRFMRFHRINLAHSQDITARLLEAMVDAVPSLELVEIEGDAVFLYAPQEQTADRSAPANALDLALSMHQAFHARQQWMVASNMCSCEACRQVGLLRVKFVAHVGEVATQTIKNRTKLVGIDVIAAHRMLKNDVPAEEYVLMTDPAYERCEPALAERAVRIGQRIEGVGTMRSYFVDLDAVAHVPARLADPRLPTRLRETAGVIVRSFPRVVGIMKLRAPDRTTSSSSS